MGEALHAAAAASSSTCRCGSTRRSASHEDLLPYLVRRLLENGANTSFVHALARRATCRPRWWPATRIAAVRGAAAARIRASPSRATSCCPSGAAPPGVDLSIAAERGACWTRALVAELDRARPAPPAPAGRERPPTSTAAFAAARGGAAGLGRGRRRGARPGCCARWPTRIEARLRAAGRAPGARGRQDPGRRRRRGARGGRLLPLLRAPRRARLRRAAAAAGPGRRDQRAGAARPRRLRRASARGTSRSRSSPARSPRRWRPATRWSPSRPSRRRDRRRGGAALPRRRARSAPAGADCPGDGERVGAGADRPSGLRRRRLHRRHGHRLRDQPQAGRRARARSCPSSPRPAASTRMFVDTTALREQVIDDVILSAFGSAGQRCSALRLLFVPRRDRRRADRGPGRRDGRAGHRRSGRSGHRRRPGDRRGGARRRWTRTLARLRARGQGDPPRSIAPPGLFFPPILAEIPDAGFLDARGVRPDPARAALRPGRAGPRSPRRWPATRYGLTLGVHSRAGGLRRRGAPRWSRPATATSTARSSARWWACSRSAARASPAPAPRPAARYALTRFAVERAVSVNTAAQGGDPALFNL